MGFLSGITKALNPVSMFGGGGGGGGGDSFSSGGIGSKSGNTDNTGNSTATSTNTTTTTTTNNTDKRLVINSGAVGVSTDSAPVTVNNQSVDPQNYQALLAVTDRLASGAIQMMAANLDTAAAAQGVTVSADGTVSKTEPKGIDETIKNNPIIAGVIVAGISFFLWKK